MTYGQARIVAQQQALRLRKLLDITEARLPLEWIEQIPGVSVHLRGAQEVENLTRVPGASGLTALKRDGTYEISLNKNSSVTHCRFTLTHELYHVITGPFEAEIFCDFGHGDEELHGQRIERVADHFAANLLVPGSLLKKAWGYQIRGLRELAGHFGVSEDVMRIRLTTVGLVDNGLTKQMFYRAPFGNWAEL
jgi:Zn-dependent peptidase ImmA (M78 family)